MSTVLPQSNFLSSKSTEENRVQFVKSSSRHVQEKSYQAPLTTPRKVLGNVSNTWQKTPANPVQAPKRSLKSTKVTLISSQIIPKKKTSVTSLKQEHHNCADIEYMPLQYSKASGYETSLTPSTSYFTNLTSALKATSTIPPSVLNALNREDSSAIHIEIRPHHSLTGSITICDDSGSVLQEQTFEDLPDIPDLNFD